PWLRDVKVCGCSTTASRPRAASRRPSCSTSGAWTAAAHGRCGRRLEAAVLEIERLTKRYGALTAVQDLSFTVAPGEVLGLLGPNGSGKSTTIKVITGLLEPTTGRVLLDGHDTRGDIIQYKASLGYVPEEPHLYSYLTGIEYLRLVGQLR